MRDKLAGGTIVGIIAVVLTIPSLFSKITIEPMPPIKIGDKPTPIFNVKNDSALWITNVSFTWLVRRIVFDNPNWKVGGNQIGGLNKVREKMDSDQAVTVACPFIQNVNFGTNQIHFICVDTTIHYYPALTLWRRSITRHFLCDRTFQCISDPLFECAAN